MWAIDWDEAGCTQYAETLEDAHKIGQRGGVFYIITYIGGVQQWMQTTSPK